MKYAAKIQVLVLLAMMDSGVQIATNVSIPVPLIYAKTNFLKSPVWLVIPTFYPQYKFCHKLLIFFLAICISACSFSCGSEPCDQTTGTCSCKDGLFGSDCDKSTVISQ